MTDLTHEQNQRLREAMLRVVDERYNGKRAALADSMGRARPTITDFLNGKSGASMETAELFCQKILKKPVAEVIGERKLTAVPRVVAQRPAGFRPSPETWRQALILLRQPPQEFTNEGLEIGLNCTVYDTLEDANNPSFVAESVRMAILGVAANLQKRPPSSGPPLQTRRSRRRAQ